jgi:hypothetical protein
VRFRSTDEDELQASIPRIKTTCVSGLYQGIVAGEVFLWLLKSVVSRTSWEQEPHDFIKSFDSLVSRWATGTQRNLVPRYLKLFQISRSNKWRQEITKFSELKKGWDSYDADAPSETAIRAALKVVENLEAAGIEPDWVTPTSDSSILIQFKKDATLFKLELDPDGDIGAMIRPEDEEAEFLDLRIESIDSFLNEYCYAGF